MAREDFLIKRLLDKDYSALKDDIEGVIAAKVVDKVMEKKKLVLNKINSTKFFNKTDDEEKPDPIEDEKNTSKDKENENEE